MPLSLNLVLGLTFAFTGVLAAGPQYWLWTFPMEPDPSAKDPSGRTTAPKLWRLVHRCLGYGFAASYFVLLVRMMPRLSFLTATKPSVWVWVHVILAMSLWPILLGKVAIIRRFQSHGKRLPVLGTALLSFSLLIIGTVAGPSFSFALRQPSSATPEDGKQLAEARCFSCHGASTILSRRSDDTWSDILEEMSEIAAKSGHPDPVRGDSVTLGITLQGIDPRVMTAEGIRGRQRNRGGGDEDE